MIDRINIGQLSRWGIGLVVLLFLGRSIASALEPAGVDNTFVPDLPTTLHNYENQALPNHFNAPPIRDLINTPNNNPITDEGATLGRVLFYDKNLSANNTISCASCHIQENGFSDPDQFSRGFEGGLTGRNSMGLQNAQFYENGAFFWDERADSLEDQTLMPIQDDVEMGLTLEEMVTKLDALDYYPELFADAFGSEDITSDRVSLALSQFVRSMISYQSKYDQGVPLDFSNFTAEEELGRNLFRTEGCAACHRTDLFVGDEARNNGLDATTIDAGLGAVTGDPDDDGKFKVPSLRNIALTGPYMHDGRFETLEEVVAFYNNGIQDHPNLDGRLTRRNGQPIRLNLTADEQVALVAFLNTLTDTAFITDDRFSDPFVEVEDEAPTDPVPEFTVRIYLPFAVR